MSTTKTLEQVTEKEIVLDEFLADFKQRYPGEDEFHQAVQEVLECILPIINNTPKDKLTTTLTGLARDNKLDTLITYDGKIDPVVTKSFKEDRYGPYLGIDQKNENKIIDIRYSMLPDEIDALWGIELSETASREEHVKWVTSREMNAKDIEKFWSMLF